MFCRCRAAADGAAGAGTAAPERHVRASDAITTLPFSQTLDTSEATTDAVEAEAAATCPVTPPAFGAGVWYRYTPTTDHYVVVSTSGSSYPVGVAVVTGVPGAFSPVTCSFAQSAFRVVAGRTYSIGIADVGARTGGTLRLSVTSAVFEVALDRFAQLDRATGAAMVSGTVTCPAGSQATLNVTLSQEKGHATAGAFGFESFPCDGARGRWSIQLPPGFGTFKPGPASVNVDAFSCLELPGALICLAESAERRVVVHPTHPRGSRLGAP